MLMRTGPLLLMLFFTRTALACVCVPGVPEPCEVLYTTTAVFYGKAVAVDSEKTTFAVEQWLQGKKPRKTIEIRRFSDCDMRFHLRKRYVVYAHGGEEGLVAFFCGRNGGLFSDRPAAGGEDIAYATHPPQRSHAVVDGKVAFTAPGNSRPPVTVRVVGKGVEQKVEADGTFHLDLPPGNYELVAEGVGVPPSRPVEIELPVAAACARPRLVLENDGQIRGMIRDASGRPAKGILVTLLRPDRSPLDHGTSQRTYDGRYEFAGLSAGKYLVGVSVDPSQAMTPDNPYPTQFHRGAPDEAHAEPIELGERVTLNDIDFIVPLPRKICRVEFRVRDEKGARAYATINVTGPGIRIARLLSMSRDPFLRVFTDADMTIEICGRDTYAPCKQLTRKFTEDTIVELAATP